MFPDNIVGSSVFLITGGKSRRLEGYLKLIGLGTVVHVCNPSPQEVGAGQSEDQRHLWLSLVTGIGAHIFSPSSRRTEAG